jgi:predicted HAD superfamily phosphohydrolase YqeG
MKMIYPNIYVDSIHDIALEELKKSRIKGFILDLDNTITLWNYRRIEVCGKI